MAIKLYAHPFSSYCQKVLIALYENNTPFEFKLLEHDNATIMAELEHLWPFKKFPVLTDNGATFREATIIIEYLQLAHGGPVQLIPSDPKTALDVRFMDRFFDNYISTPQQKIVFDSICAADDRDPHGVAQARCMLDTAYEWLDNYMQSRQWAVDDAFSLADCGAAPFLFYADWSHRIDAKFKNVIAYRKRLLARPSVVRVVDEARPYRRFFPLGAPDRD
ncbi:MAG: glutathione S-transferase family protein [Spongiibacteraceae bacterium]